MKLISCSFCGVIIDTDRIIEPNIYNDDLSINEKANYIWQDDDFKPCIRCPACKGKITYEAGEK